MALLKQPKAIIFDMDGVIIDSEGVNIKTATKSYKKLGINLTQKDLQQVIGRHPKDYNRIFAKKYNFNKEEVWHYQNKYFPPLYQQASIIKDAVKLIHELKKQKIRLALATSSHRENADKVIKKAGLENVFDIIVVFEDCQERKPDPEVYITTAKKLKLSPKNCLVFEDTQIGIKAAKNADMQCIALPNQYTRNQDFSRADSILNSALDYLK